MIAKSLQTLRPGAQWVLRGDTYEGLEWLSTDVTKPTLEEIEAESARLEAEYTATQYQRDRAKAYPAIGDQLDALWKGGEAAAAMLAQVQAIKAQFPKG